MRGPPGQQRGRGETLDAPVVVPRAVRLDQAVERAQERRNDILGPAVDDVVDEVHRRIVAEGPVVPSAHAVR
jgi:hypothetical protein